MREIVGASLPFVLRPFRMRVKAFNRRGRKGRRQMR